MYVMHLKCFTIVGCALDVEPFKKFSNQIDQQRCDKKRNQRLESIDQIFWHQINKINDCRNYVKNNGVQQESAYVLFLI